MKMTLYTCEQGSCACARASSNVDEDFVGTEDFFFRVVSLKGMASSRYVSIQKRLYWPNLLNKKT